MEEADMMENLQALEQCYKEYSKNLTEWVPDGLVEVNLEFLFNFNLLDCLRDEEHIFNNLTQFFHVIENHEKITLINEQFVIWIVPELQNYKSITYVLVALNEEKGPHLELAFFTTGVYNSSKFVLRVLEKFLNEIKESEEIIHKLIS